MERTGIITMRGKPLTLVGPDIKVGDPAPDFTVLDNERREVRFRELQKGIVRLISVTPSLDTPVCDLQLRRFNSEAAALPAKTEVFNISMDLPFAITRFCATAGIERARTFSDHREASFGTAYGLLVKETRLLARAVMIIDGNNIVRYREIVPEQSNHPDYDKALAELRRIAVFAKAA